jgi:hypothetical protein
LHLCETEPGPGRLDPPMMRLPGRPSVRTDERITALERDMVRLETVMERVLLGMETERNDAKASRVELWASLKELGSKMERSVTGLAEEMKKMAEKNATTDTQVLTRQSQDQGAVIAAKYIIGVLLSIAAVTGAFRMGEKQQHSRPVPMALYINALQ